MHGFMHEPLTVFWGVIALWLLALLAIRQALLAYRLDDHIDDDDDHWDEERIREVIDASPMSRSLQQRVRRLEETSEINPLTIAQRREVQRIAEQAAEAAFKDGLSASLGSGEMAEVATAYLEGKAFNRRLERVVRGEWERMMAERTAANRISAEVQEAITLANRIGWRVVTDPGWKSARGEQKAVAWVYGKAGGEIAMAIADTPHAASELALEKAAKRVRGDDLMTEPVRSGSDVNND